MTSRMLAPAGRSTDSSLRSGLLDLRRRLDRTGPYARVVEDQPTSAAAVPAGGPLTRAERYLLDNRYVAYPRNDLSRVMSGELTWPLMTAEDVISFVADQTGLEESVVRPVLPDVRYRSRQTQKVTGRLFIRGRQGRDDWMIQRASTLPDLALALSDASGE